MSIADKLTTIAENVPKVYEAGKAAGGGGAVTVETYFNGTLYNQSTEYEALMKGDVDMIVTSLNYAMEYIPELNSTFCPYMWVSIDHVRDFWAKDPVGVGLMQRMEEEWQQQQVLFQQLHGDHYDN